MRMNFDRTSMAQTLRSPGMVALFMLWFAAAAGPANQAGNGCPGLHAGISAQLVTRKPPSTQPSFVMISFVLLNDRDSAADSYPGSWTLVVDGKELDDSGMIFGNGPMPVGGYGTLAPGESYSFGKGLDLKGYFPVAGVYSLTWKGKEFQSPTLKVTIVKSDD
jgi:hypothetical protein